MQEKNLLRLMELMLTLLLLTAGPSYAQPVSENGDAGELPATAQDASGATTITGTITGLRIYGQIWANEDVDMYKITITDPSGFSATTRNNVTDFDTILLLFGLDGRAVYMSNDTPKPYPPPPPAIFPFRQSTLPAGDPLGPEDPGDYYLAVTAYNRLPEDAGNERLFESGSSTQRQGPLSTNPIHHWKTYYFFGGELDGKDTGKLKPPSDPGPFTGSYQIDITGVESPNLPPVADAGEDQTVEANTAGSANVQLDGSGSYDPEGSLLTYSWTWDSESATGVDPTITLPLGTTTVTLVVNDGTVDSEPDTVDITVVDTTSPEVLLFEPEPSVLWPPNHKLVDITVLGIAFDTCDTDLDIDVSVEVVDFGHGDGGPQHQPDYNIVHANVDGDGIIEIIVSLRAERSGQGDGRIYRITAEVTDGSGNSGSDTVEVLVPHDEGQE